MDELYARSEHAIAALQLGFAMLGMGALLGPRDFVSVFRVPRALFVGLGLQWLIVPLLAASVPDLMLVGGGVTVGLILVAAVPGGTMSNVFTHFAQGNIALSISLTALTTVASLLTTPLLLRIFAGEHLPADFEMPTGRIATEIGLILLLPLVTGMLAGARLGDEARERLSRTAIRISIAFIALLVVGAVASNRLDVTRYTATEQQSVLLLVTCFFVVSFGVARLARLPDADRAAIGIEVTLRNINLGVLVKASLFPASEGHPIGDAVLFVIAMYGGVQMMLAAIPIGLRRFGISL